mmetsp:Transcript_25957/g.72452  ORF Transcript_25957/g.72452 Transcript_25957/m.72452 type:complete len:142 (-) Transcript_25957:144-569(-)
MCSGQSPLEDFGAQASHRLDLSRYTTKELHFLMQCEGLTPLLQKPRVGGGPGGTVAPAPLLPAGSSDICAQLLAQGPWFLRKFGGYIFCIVAALLCATGLFLGCPPVRPHALALVQKTRWRKAKTDKCDEECRGEVAMTDM